MSLATVFNESQIEGAKVSQYKVAIPQNPSDFFSMDVMSLAVATWKPRVSALVVCRLSMTLLALLASMASEISILEAKMKVQ